MGEGTIVADVESESDAVTESRGGVVDGFFNEQIVDEAGWIHCGTGSVVGGIVVEEIAIDGGGVGDGRDGTNSDGGGDGERFGSADGEVADVPDAAAGAVGAGGDGVGQVGEAGGEQVIDDDAGVVIAGEVAGDDGENDITEDFLVAVVDGFDDGEI